MLDYFLRGLYFLFGITISAKIQLPILKVAQCVLATPAIFIYGIGDIFSYFGYLVMRYVFSQKKMRFSSNVLRFLGSGKF